MTGNPFDADGGDGGGSAGGGGGAWQVVVNDRAEYALWRPFLDLPPGWHVVVPDTDRETALDRVEQLWTAPDRCRQQARRRA